MIKWGRSHMKKKRNVLMNRAIVIVITTIFLMIPWTGFYNIPMRAEQINECDPDVPMKNTINTPVNYDGALDIQFIYNLTENLSYIIFKVYSKGEIAKGRAFGTKGEHQAAEIIYENMTKFGLYTKKEQIENIPQCPTVASKLEILDYKLTITNKTSNCSEVVDCYIAPTWAGPREQPKQIDYNFSFKGLKIKHRPKLESLRSFNRALAGQKENYVFIDEEQAFNPNKSAPPIVKILSMFLSPFSGPVLFWNSCKLKVQLIMWYRLFPRCQGIVLYDFNDDTYNMQNSVLQKLPIIHINGTIGKKIAENPKDYTIDYYLNQSYNESVLSYNVIGQLNGTDPSKTVIVCSLYDSWWCQGTADSAMGMSIVLGIAKYFHDHNITPKYNIKFIAFGGEEYGYRGAKYYEAAHRYDGSETVTTVIDLNQLCFTQEKPRLTFNIISNKLKFLNELWGIAERTDYVSRTGDVADINKVWMPLGAPSNDQPFARNRRSCKTICFLKDTGWTLHHRDGLNHTEGDVIKYFNWTDVDVTGELILNITKYLTIDTQEPLQPYNMWKNPNLMLRSIQRR